MSFLHVEWFLLILLLLPFGYFVLKLKNGDIESIFSKEVIEKILIKKEKGLSKKTRYFLLLFTLLMMVIALARPVIDEGKKQDAQIEGFNLIVALDISRSMMAKDIFPNRLEYAKRLLNQLFDALPEANVAVIAFSKDAFLVSPLSSDKESIKYLIKHLEPKYLSSSGSSLVAAVSSSQKILDLLKEKRSAFLIVSDGADGEEVQKASELIAEKLQVFVLNIGTKKGSVIELENGELLKDAKGNIVVSKRDDSLIQLSQSSGGSFLSVPDNGVDIKPLIDDLKQKIKKQTIQKNETIEYKELFYYPLILALISLFFALNQPRLFVLLFVLFIHQEAKAGIFDFYHIDKANKSFQNKEYENALKEFKEVQSPEAKYNEANALYRLKKFEEAKKAYESIEGLEGKKEFQKLHNLGNTYANLGEDEKAIDSYEKALKIEEDEDTKYNLELLKKKKEQQEQQNKNQENKEKNKQDKNKEEKEKNQQNSSDKNEQKKEDEKSKEEKDSQQNKQQEQNKKEKQESQNDTKQQSEKQSEQMQKQMSETEAKKWEQLLKNQEIKTQPLLLQKNKEDSSEKNW